MNQFGPDFGRKHFMLDPDVVNLNHGSFGAAARVAVEAQIASIYKTQSFPDHEIRKTLIEPDDPRIKSRSLVANVLDADPSNMVFVSSATTAYAAVLTAFPFTKGDKVLFMSSIYINDINGLKSLVKSIGIELHEFVVEYPRESDSKLLQRFEAALKEIKPVMAIFDTVSSAPSDLFPWEDMCRACRDNRVVSFVDGAHGIGLVPISLRSALPSFFTTNLHKWYNANPGTAVLYADGEHHNILNGFPISAFDPTSTDNPKRLAKMFGYMSTLNYSSFDSVEAVVEFRKQFGDEAIMAYQNDLAAQASELMCRELGTTKLCGSLKPLALFTLISPVQPDDPARFIKFMHARLVQKWKTYVPFFVYGGQVQLRLSATIYLDLSSFEYGVKALKECFDAYQASLNE